MQLCEARGVFPEAVVATSMAGRLMADSTEEAWDALCLLLTYMYQRKSRGIRFSSRGNLYMICYVDASNRPDPTAGKAQFGYVIMIQGGPMVSVSKKTNQVGQSASHNECMAITHAAKHVAWTRDLLSEMGLKEDDVMGRQQSSKSTITWKYYYMWERIHPAAFSLHKTGSGSWKYRSIGHCELRQYCWFNDESLHEACSRQIGTSDDEVRTAALSETKGS